MQIWREIQPALTTTPSRFSYNGDCRMVFRRWLHIHGRTRSTPCRSSATMYMKPTPEDHATIAVVTEPGGRCSQSWLYFPPNLHSRNSGSDWRLLLTEGDVFQEPQRTRQLRSVACPKPAQVQHSTRKCMAI